MRTKTKWALALAASLYLCRPQVADAGDSCQSFICMAGKPLMNNGTVSAECGGAVGDFFSIVRFDFWGIFDPGRTAAARGEYLARCPGTGENAEILSRIVAIYGPMMFDVD